MLTPDPPDGTSTTDLLSPGVTAAVQERRASKRAGRRIDLRLTGLGSAAGFGCTTEDISESGLYVRIPAKVGLTVGKRVEVQFGDEAQSAKPSRFRGETCFATVVRTKVDQHEPSPVIGAGLRFDQPLFL